MNSTGIHYTLLCSYSIKLGEYYYFTNKDRDFVFLQNKLGYLATLSRWWISNITGEGWWVEQTKHHEQLSLPIDSNCKYIVLNNYINQIQGQSQIRLHNKISQMIFYYTGFLIFTKYQHFSKNAILSRNLIF